jgi:predicted ATPase
MLTEIQLQNFKCFRENNQIPFKRINLLTGINGRGKSTTLQALLLMRQSPDHNRATTHIILNSTCVKLGSFDDIRNTETPKSEPIKIRFRFTNEDTDIALTYFLNDNSDDEMIANITHIDVLHKTNQAEYKLSMVPTYQLGNQPQEIKILDARKDEEISGIVLFWENLLFDLMLVNAKSGEAFIYLHDSIDFRKIHYISADRLGPQDFYPKQSFSEFPNVGVHGELTANALAKKKNDLVNQSLCLEVGATHTVLDQTEAWLDLIFGGGKIAVDQPHANIVLMALNSERTTNFYKPINVGFGYSYALPIIVTGLIAAPGEMLIIENPEAHLHPSAQSQLTKFLAKVSQTGVQVFIESHSDHVLNALRVAVLDQIITADDLNILYFDRDVELKVHQIPVKQDGSIEYWPTGFFDQTDKDFERLFAL